MQKILAQTKKNIPEEVSVGANECRLARQGERLVARGVLADVVVTIQVPAAGFAAMLRVAAPLESNVPRARLEALWGFADEALDLLLKSIRSMNISAEAVTVSAMGGADLAGVTFGRGKQLSLAVQRSFWRHGIIVNGSDLGGCHSRLIWLESTSGRLIVRSKSPLLSPIAEMQALQSKAS